MTEPMPESMPESRICIGNWWDAHRKTKDTHSIMQGNAGNASGNVQKYKGTIKKCVAKIQRYACIGKQREMQTSMLGNALEIQRDALENARKRIGKYEDMHWKIKGYA